MKKLLIRLFGAEWYCRYWHSAIETADNKWYCKSCNLTREKRDSDNDLGAG